MKFELKTLRNMRRSLKLGFGSLYGSIFSRRTVRQRLAIGRIIISLVLMQAAITQAISENIEIP